MRSLWTFVSVYLAFIEIYIYELYLFMHYLLLALKIVKKIKNHHHQVHPALVGKMMVFIIVNQEKNIKEDIKKEEAHPVQNLHQVVLQRKRVRGTGVLKRNQSPLQEAHQKTHINQSLPARTFKPEFRLAIMTIIMKATKWKERIMKIKDKKKIKKKIKKNKKIKIKIKLNKYQMIKDKRIKIRITMVSLERKMILIKCVQLY